MSNRNKQNRNQSKAGDKLDLSSPPVTAGVATAAAAAPMPADFDPNVPISPEQVFGDGIGDSAIPADSESVVPSGTDGHSAAATDDLAKGKTGEPRGTVLIELPPLVSLSHQERTGFASSHVDVQLRRQEPRRLKQLHKSLVENNARLDGGTGPHVRTTGDAVRWLIQQLPEVA